MAGNWKMNKTFQEAEDLLDELAGRLNEEQEDQDVEVIVCPPYLYVEMAHDLCSDEDDATQVYYSVGVQDVSEHDKGAHTGEVSAAMLSSLDVESRS